MTYWPNIVIFFNFNKTQLIEDKKVAHLLEVCIKKLHRELLGAGLMRYEAKKEYNQSTLDLEQLISLHNT